MTDWLVGTLIASSMLMAVVLLVREPARRLFGPAVTYALWLLPATRMILPSFTQTVERTIPASVAPAVRLAPPIEMPATADPARRVDSIASLGGWPTLLILLWASGAAVMLVRGLLIYRAQRRAIPLKPERNKSFGP